MVHSFLLLCCLNLIGLRTAQAETVKYLVDPEKSKIAFTSPTAFYDVVGEFHDFSGEILHDSTLITNSEIKITINVASLDSGHEGRDEHLRGADFFAVDAYPEADFKSIRVAALENGSYSFLGRMTVRGIRKPTTWIVTQEDQYTDENGKRRIVFSGHTTVNRQDFGIFWNADESYNPLNAEKREGFWERAKGAWNDTLKTVGNKFILTDEVQLNVIIAAVEQ